MNNDIDPINDPISRTLRQRFPLSASPETRATLLYRCGEAAANAANQRRRNTGRWMSVALVCLALGIGGWAGRLSRSTPSNQLVVDSTDYETKVKDDESTWDFESLISETGTPRRADSGVTMMAVMDLDQVQFARVSKPVRTRKGRQSPRPATNPLSVWMQPLGPD